MNQQTQQYLVMEIPEEYYEVQKIIHQYKDALCSKFRNQEEMLIQELQNKAKTLKEHIAFYKKETSQQNIEKLISKKRHQKEAERLQLQVQWRNLTQKYKKLRQQQKKINQQNQESQFDLNNLKVKIQQLSKNNIELQQKITTLKGQTDNYQFMTETNVLSRVNSSNHIKQNIQTIKNKQQQFTEIDPQKKKKLSSDSCFQLKQSTISKSNIKKQPLNLSVRQSSLRIGQVLAPLSKNMNNRTQSDFKIFKSQERHLTFDPSLLSRNKQKKHICDEKWRRSEERSLSKKSFFQNKGQKWGELMSYLARSDVRDKIFDILRK